MNNPTRTAGITVSVTITDGDRVITDWTTIDPAVWTDGPLDEVITNTTTEIGREAATDWNRAA